MRPPSASPRTDRNREDAGVESHSCDEGLQPYTGHPTNTEHALHDNDPAFAYQSLPPHNGAIESVMTDAPFASYTAPAARFTPAAYSAAPFFSAPVSSAPAPSSAVSSPLLPHSDEEPDEDLSDLDLDDDNYDPDDDEFRPSSPEDDDVDMEDASDSDDENMAIFPPGMDLAAFGLPNPPTGTNAPPTGEPETLLHNMNVHGPMVSNPNPIMLGGENFGLHDFLRYWATQPMREETPLPDHPNVDRILGLSRDLVEVSRSDLRGESYDMQGLDWRHIETNRRAARRYRFGSYKNYTNKVGSDVWMPNMPDKHLPTRDNFYRFKRMLIRGDSRLAHFQLRSVLACPTRHHALYPSMSCVRRVNLDTKASDMAVDLHHIEGLGSLVSALDAKHGVLVAGMFNGEYCVQNLESENPKGFSNGRITNHISGITNHLQVHLPRRSSAPVAALANNDNGFRVLDLTTEKLLLELQMPTSINCSAISPDGRLRVMVGDMFNVLISSADTGHIERELTGHRDYGFSCDWSDDGWTIATGFQDKAIKIWDARKWTNSNGKAAPITTIRTKMANARNLRFSPNGSGRRVLVAAEEVDYVHVIDAVTYESKQSIDVFSEIGGIAYSDEGRNLTVLCNDSFRGGLLQLERCGTSSEPHAFDIDWRDGFDQQSEAYEPQFRSRSMPKETLFF